MGLKRELDDGVAAICRDQWSLRKGQGVPDPENLRLSNDAVEFDRATILYADLAGSTALVDSKAWWFSAEVYKTFLLCAAKIVRSESPFRNGCGTYPARGWMVGSDVIPGRCSKPCRRPHVDADHPCAA